MKTSRIFTVIALTVLAAACAKEKEVAEEQAPVVPTDPNTIVFKAEFTKTTIDSNDEVVSWEAGDQVRFSWDGGYTVAEASTAGASTTFSVTVDDGVTEIYAIYPASAGGSLNDGKVTVHYSGSRADGSFAANDICVARAVKSGDAWNTSLAFKNAACLLKVGVTSSEITKLRVEAVGGEEIAGAFEVSMDGDGNPVVGDAVGTVGSMSAMTVSGPGNYYIPIKPGVTLSDGFRVSRFIGDDQTTPFYYNGEFTTTRGKIFKLDDIDAHAGHFYVTPDGAGTKSGQSWSNAMDGATFKAFIENNEGNNFFIIKGSTFHFSAEEFTFGDYLQPSFDEHGEVNFTLEGMISGDAMTTFIGGTGDTAGMLWPKTSANVTVKNIKFKGTDGNSNRGAIRLNSSSAKLTLENCIFDSNKTSGNGGAIVLFKCSELNITNCDFLNNVGARGAAIFFEAQANVTVNVTGGSFVGNNTTGNDAGSVVYSSSNSGNPTFCFNNVTFKDNYYKSDATDAGGIIRINTSTGKAYFDHCVFDGNYQTGSSNLTGIAGAAILLIKSNPPVIYFNACEFKNNYSAKGHQSMVFGVTNTATIAMNNCSWHDNRSGRNSTGNANWIMLGNTSAKLIISNSSIIGDQQRSGTNLGKEGVIKIEGTTNNVHLINNILCSNYSDGKSIRCTASLELNSYYNKTSPGYDSNTVWSSDYGSGHDYYASSSCFGGWSAPFSWNGTLTGTNSNMKAETADVNAEIHDADADFYSWLNSIGALGKDINGNSRGEISWPGCYQN